MSDLITTTVSLDTAANVNQQVIHLVQGDYGTRALRLIPIDNGRLTNLETAGVIGAKVIMACEGQEGLQIDCTLGDKYVTLVPTQAMTSSAHEWNCQLRLYTSLDPETALVTSWPFRINVHGTVFNGDTVEHTNSRVLAALYLDDAEHLGDLVIESMDGNTVTAGGKSNLAEYVEGVLSAAGELVTAADRTAINSIGNYLDQSVKTTDAPTFSGLRIGDLSIDENGVLTGARFT